MVKRLERWETAQLSATSPEDWENVDKLAIELANQGFASIADLGLAVRLAINRLRGTTDLPIDVGTPGAVWVEHFLHAVWDALKEGEKIQRNYYDLPFAAHSILSDNKIYAVSRSWCDLLGYTFDEVIGRPSTEFLTEESQRMALVNYLPKFWKQGSLSKVEYTMVHKQGHEVSISLSAAAEFDMKGRPVRSLAILSPR